MGLNMGSVLAKAQAAIAPGGSAHGRWKSTTDKVLAGKIKIKSGSVHTPQEAANKFIEVLQDNISSSVSANVASAISNLSASAPQKLGDGIYVVSVYFSGDLSRDSLVPGERLRDLAELFDQGMAIHDPTRPAFGIWHGHRITGVTSIPAAGFMDAAVSEFMGSYADEYNVISCTVNR